MKYENPRLRDQLAAEYVLGTLRGRARMRFRRLLKYDVALRRNVSTWEARLAPLDELAPAVTPPARIWRTISARIGGGARRRSVWTSLGFWRGLAAAASICVLALAVYLGVAPQAEPRAAMMAVLSDDKANPAVLIAWPPQQSERNRYLKLRVQTHPEMAANTSWELWMLPGGKEAPVSLGQVGTEPDQIIRLSAAASHAIDKAWGLAISIEPKGGSPTGQPTGPVIMQGPCVKVI